MKQFISSNINPKDELIFLRTENEKHFRMSDGSHLAALYHTAVHYRNEDGEYADIDNRLTLREENGEPVCTEKGNGDKQRQLYVNAAGNLSVRFAARLGKLPLLRLVGKGYALAMSPAPIKNKKPKKVTAELLPVTAGEAPAWGPIAPVNIGAEVRYSEIYKSVDMTYLLYGNHVKEKIEIRDIQAGSRFPFLLTLEGLTAKTNGQAGIVLQNADGKPIFEIPPPAVWDAAGNMCENAKVTLSITKGEQHKLTLAVDPIWMASPERVYPVTIDPPIFLVEHSTDKDNVVETSYVWEKNPDSYTYSTPYLYIGSEIAAPRPLRYRMLFRANRLPSLPENSVVVGAFLGMTRAGYSSVGLDTFHTEAHSLLDNYPQDGFWVRKKTWNQMAQLPVDPRVIDYTTVNKGEAGASAMWELTKEVISWYRYPGTNFGLQFQTTEESAMTAVSCANAWYYGNAAAQYNPVFMVNYRNASGILGHLTYQTQDIGRAGTGYIGDFTCQMTLVKTDAVSASTVNPLTVNHVYNSAVSASNYKPGGTSLYNAMPVGFGWMMSCHEAVTTVKINDTTDTYLLYVDGDGANHYFLKEAPPSSVYNDEDGLNLSITKSGGSYTMQDKYGNIKFFANGMLTYAKDTNGNIIRYIYNNTAAPESGTGWYPTGSGTDRLLEIRRQNTGTASVRLLSLAYLWGYLDTVTDEAGNTTRFEYSTIGGKVCLTVVTHPDGTVAKYEYNVAGNRLSAAIDTESGRTVTYNYSAQSGKLIHCGESVRSGSQITEGAFFGINGETSGRTLYRYCGADRAFYTGDDILTTCLFDNSCRTVNVYSTDESGKKILGARSDMYTTNIAASDRNNRLLTNSVIGVAAANLIKNGGAERFSGSAVMDWSFHGPGEGSVDQRLTHYGRRSLSIRCAAAQSQPSYYAQATTALKGSVSYVFSAYVNTQYMTPSSTAKAYLVFEDQTSEVITWATKPGVDSGWLRISARYTPPADGVRTVYAYAEGMAGTVFFDDFQLEEGEAPSGVNLIENGSMTVQGIWSPSSPGAFMYVNDERFGQSIVIESTPVTVRYAGQTVQLNQPASQTYVMAGWARGDSVFDAVHITGRYFGLYAQLHYTDGTVEDHFATFSSDIIEWQYASMPIVPKQADKMVSHIAMYLSYYRNSNLAVFHNISLVPEEAQAYTYDAEGKLTGVQSTRNNEETFTYQGPDISSQMTKGSGKLEYQYDSRHNLTQIKHDVLTTALTINGAGNTTGAKMTGSGTDRFITAGDTYTNSENLVYTVTDSRGYSTKYDYASPISRQLGQATSVTDAKGTTVFTGYNPTNGRPLMAYISGVVSTDYGYENGRLALIARGGYLPGSTAKVTQSYSLLYDGFGNLKDFKTGGRTLESYTYAAGNGNLLQKQFGNNQYADYAYDTEERLTSVAYNGDSSQGFAYTYTGEGNIGSIEYPGIDRKHYYRYDSLSRLTGESVWTGEVSEQQGAYRYDRANRLIGADYSIKGFPDRGYQYVYNDTNGLLSRMMVPEQSLLVYNYDQLNRLSSRTMDGGYNKNYAYITNYQTNTTTLMVENLTYKTAAGQLWKSLWYSYDEIGNIKGVTGGGGISYEYDSLNRLTKETQPGIVYQYSYDSFGNLYSRTKTTNNQGTSYSYTYAYGDSGWRDLLTAFNGGGITYDGRGNPLTYHDGTSFEWQNGTQLKTLSRDGLTVSFRYGEDGMRIGKTSSFEDSRYFYQNGRLAAELRGDTRLEFTYDESGKPFSLLLNGIGTYFYITNLQGDVEQIRDLSGNILANYVYNAWGEVISQSGVLSEINPLRYRGYYFDYETGYYYLASRYYDPQTGRFLSADAVATVSASPFGLTGKNLFAYCMNNPIRYADYTGESATDVLRWGWRAAGVISQFDSPVLGPADAVALGIVIGATVVAGIMIIPWDSVGSGLSKGWNWVKNGVKAIAASFAISQAISKTMSKAKTKIRTERNRYDYWIAAYVGIGDEGTFIPTLALSYSSAMAYVRAGGNVFADSKSNAYRLALAVGNGRAPTRPERHGSAASGYWYHYHAGKRSGGHIFYVT